MAKKTINERWIFDAFSLMLWRQWQGDPSAKRRPPSRVQAAKTLVSFHSPVSCRCHALIMTNALVSLSFPSHTHSSWKASHRLAAEVLDRGCAAPRDLPRPLGSQW